MVAAAVVAAAFSVAGVGCANVLGDFTVVGGGDGGTPDGYIAPPTDAGVPDSHGMHPVDSGNVDSGSALDAGVDAPPPPPPTPGKPGLDITSGGNFSSSPSYKLVGAIGEPPGSNVIGKSTSYTLNGGVVAITQ